MQSNSYRTCSEASGLERYCPPLPSQSPIKHISKWCLTRRNESKAFRVMKVLPLVWRPPDGYLQYQRMLKAKDQGSRQWGLSWSFSVLVLMENVQSTSLSFGFLLQCFNERLRLLGNWHWTFTVSLLWKTVRGTIRCRSSSALPMGGILSRQKKRKRIAVTTWKTYMAFTFQWTTMTRQIGPNHHLYGVFTWTFCFWMNSEWKTGCRRDYGGSWCVVYGWVETVSSFQLRQLLLV